MLTKTVTWSKFFKSGYSVAEISLTEEWPHDNVHLIDLVKLFGSRDWLSKRYTTRPDHFNKTNIIVYLKLTNQL